MSCKTKLQVRIDDYAYGVWFDTTDIDPYANTIRIYDHLFEKERSFVDDGSFQYREVDVVSE